MFRIYRTRVYPGNSSLEFLKTSNNLINLYPSNPKLAKFHFCSCYQLDCVKDLCNNLCLVERDLSQSQEQATSRHKVAISTILS